MPTRLPFALSLALMLVPTAPACAQTSTSNQQAAAPAHLRLRGGVRRVRARDGFARHPARWVGEARHPQPDAENARAQAQCVLPNSKLTLFPPNANELLSTLRQGVSMRAVGT